MIRDYTVEQIIASFNNSKVASILVGVTSPSYYEYSFALKTVGDRQSSAESVLYELLSDACSLEFGQRGEEVYSPHIRLANGSRSASLEDFVGEVAEVLLGIFEQIDNSLLKARVADILWVNRKLTKSDRPLRFAKAALDGYCAINIAQWEEWTVCGEGILLRAIELAMSLKKEGLKYVQVLKEKLIEACHTLPEDDCHSLFTICRIVLVCGLPIEDSTIIYDKIEKVVAGLSIPSQINEINIGYALLIKWYEKDKRLEDINRCLLAKAETNRIAGEGWTKGNVDPGIVCARLEEAQRCYDKLSKQYKDANGVAQLQKNVQKLLHETYKKISDDMQRVRGAPTDIRKYVEATRKDMYGLTFSRAICRFVAGFNVSVSILRSSTRDMLNEHPIMGLFQHFSYENGVVASRQDGINFGDPDYDKSQHFHQLVVQQFVHQLSFVWQAHLFPAFSVLIDEHKISDCDYYSIVESSKFVPRNRRFLFARGIKAGFLQDFQTAAALLLPQIENAVRIHLKAHGVNTFAHDVTKEIDTEIGLSSLVGRDDVMSRLFDENLSFVMKAMFGPSPNLNLRNQYAHGLIDDCEGISMFDFYIWYFALKLIVIGCVDHPEKSGLKLPDSLCRGKENQGSNVVATPR